MADVGYWYLATPYTKYPFGLDQAAEDASYLAGKLLKSGIHVYSPIAFGHQMSVHADIPNLDTETWLRLNVSMMTPAVGLIVAKMLSWGDSDGVADEIERFRDVEKPIMYLECEDELQERARRGIEEGGGGEGGSTRGHAHTPRDDIWPLVCASRGDGDAA